MKKTLYVTDLDGTLLNSSGQLSARSREGIRRLAQSGILFTWATARTLPMAQKALGGIRPVAPAVYNNGAAIYNHATGEFARLVSIQQYIPRLQAALAGGQLGYFVYAAHGHNLHLLYHSIPGPVEQAYLDARKDIYGERVARIASLGGMPEGYVPIFLVLYAKEEQLLPVSERLAKIEGLQHVLYGDVYNRAFYFMDVFAACTSKAEAVAALKKMVGAEEVVAFGDNLNDIEMLTLADRSYATGNAVEEAKAAAGEVIGHCDDSAVIEFILKENGLA